jgi:hypothetical protein
MFGAVATALAAREHPLLQAVLWTVLLVASFAGWGSILNYWIARKRWADWGLRAGWGMSICVLVGGFLSLLHLVNRVVLIGQVVVGLAALLALSPGRWRFSATRFRRRLALAIDRLGVIALLAAGYALLTLFVLACFGDHSFQPSDDPALYIALSKKLVESGSILSPFEAHRMPILGGHFYLQALFLAVGSPWYPHVADGGLCVAIIWGLVVGHIARGGLKNRHLVPLAMVLLLFFGLRSVQVNTGSLFSGVVPILTMYRTVREPAEDGAQRPAGTFETWRIAAFGALAVGAIVMRSSIIGAVLSFPVLILTFDFVRAHRRPWERHALAPFLRQFLIFGLAVGVTLLPWSIMDKQTSGTFLYPFGHNNLTAGLTFMSQHNKGDEVLTRFVANLTYWKPIATLLPFLVAGLVPLAGPRKSDLVALTLATFICMGTLTQSGFDPIDTSRYQFAPVVTMALMVTASAGPSGPLSTLAGIALAGHLGISMGEWHENLKSKVAQANAALAETKADRAAWDNLTKDYLDVQSHVPPGATMVTAVREGFRFDFRRNTIHMLGALGAMGPKPGWPAHQGPEALATYLRDNGVDYIVWVDFNEPGELYGRSHLQSNAAAKDSTMGKWAALHLEVEDTIEALPKIRRVVYVGHGMTVVDLRAPPGSG